MNYDLTNAVEILNKENYTCVLCCGDDKYTSSKRGVKPLIDWLESGIDFNGFSAADKVVGNAAAFLYVLLGIKAVYAPVISEAAIHTLKENGVEIQYDLAVEYIVNRSGDGNCPMEESVKGISDPEKALCAIRKKLKELMNIG
ncbi:MAG: DUF1893 domain-containing protein [Eubacterium sp.]|nr:DUF1893 domain-containing protein [Eubacterium sp.]